MSLLSVEFRSLHNNGEWILTNVYGPCTFEIKRKFTLWLKHIQMPDDVEWLLHGDSNLSRDPGNRSKPCGDLAYMFLYSETISSLGLVGGQFTSTRIRNCPLLPERLDWSFISN